MNADPTKTWTSDEIELRLLQRAVDEAMREAGRGVANGIVCAEMQKEIDELEQKIAALMKSEG